MHIYRKSWVRNFRQMLITHLQKSAIIKKAQESIIEIDYCIRDYRMTLSIEVPEQKKSRGEPVFNLLFGTYGTPLPLSKGPHFKLTVRHSANKGVKTNISMINSCVPET